MATSPNLYQSPTASRPGWLSRNWKWAVPLGLFLLMLLFAGFIGSILLILETSFQHSDFYVQGLARARANPQVIEKLGQPITPGWFSSGSVSVSGPTGDANISIPISGPKGKGTIYVVAKKSAGEWTFLKLEVEIEGQRQRIQLVKAAETTPAEN